MEMFKVIVAMATVSSITAAGTDGTCEMDGCPYNQVVESGSCVVLAGGVCQAGKQSCVAGAICKSKSCVCQSGYIEDVETGLCLTTKTTISGFDGACTCNKDCDKGLVCGEDSKCSCPYGSTYNKNYKSSSSPSVTTPRCELDIGVRYDYSNLNGPMCSSNSFNYLTRRCNCAYPLTHNTKSKACDCQGAAYLNNSKTCVAMVNATCKESGFGWTCSCPEGAVMNVEKTECKCPAGQKIDRNAGKCQKSV